MNVMHADDSANERIKKLEQKRKNRWDRKKDLKNYIQRRNRSASTYNS